MNQALLNKVIQRTIVTPGRGFDYMMGRTEWTGRSQWGAGERGRRAMIFQTLSNNSWVRINAGHSGRRGSDDGISISLLSPRGASSKIPALRLRTGKAESRVGTTADKLFWHGRASCRSALDGVVDLLRGGSGRRIGNTTCSVVVLDLIDLYCVASVTYKLN